MADVPVPNPVRPVRDSVRLVPWPRPWKPSPANTDQPARLDALIFDPEWYLETYPDVAKRRIDPVRHYLDHGAGEGRNPNRHFSTAGYLDRNPDVQRTGVNPFLHFLLYGFREGRTWTGPDASTPAGR